MREAIRKEALPVELFVAKDGQEAIDFIARAETDPDAPSPQLLLVDLNLPKRDGFEVLRRLRESEKCGDVPVLVVTSSDSPTDQTAAAELGAWYFRKPPSYEEFLKLGRVMKRMLLERGILEGHE